MQKNNIRFD